ncbi:MAG: DUF4271 domain-containing protein [Prevotella sp.]|nr:DUF4271 domain-containing protein [Prevotella sp.]
MTQSTATSSTHGTTGGSQQPVVHHKTYLTPAQAISRLPKDATPAQQDSAVQAHAKFSEIHWSQEPDTLHMPGHGKGKSVKDIHIPQYYRESFFSKDTLFHPELPGGRQGVAGDPIPYSIANDNLITSLLLGCFVMALLTMAHTRAFIIRQAKSFYYSTHEQTNKLTETTGEVWFQLFMVLQTCLLLAILYIYYVRDRIGETFIIEQYQMVGMFTSFFAIYFLIRSTLYELTGWVFFSKKKILQWQKSSLFLTSAEGVLLFPAVMLLAFFNTTMESVMVYVLFIVILVKILSFYKLYVIFFKRKGIFLQIFLYFCALEIVPLFVIGGLLLIINNYLKVNF